MVYRALVDTTKGCKIMCDIFMYRLVQTQKKICLPCPLIVLHNTFFYGIQLFQSSKHPLVPTYSDNWHTEFYMHVANSDMVL